MSKSHSNYILFSKSGFLDGLNDLFDLISFYTLDLDIWHRLCDRLNLKITYLKIYYPDVNIYPGM